MKSIWVVIACIPFLTACLYQSLPSIDDPAQLTRDCDVLLTGPAPFESIAKNRWPASIAQLEPVMVEKEESALYITTFARVDMGARGYVVSHARPAPTDHRSISDTAYPNIYRYDFIP